MSVTVRPYVNGGWARAARPRQAKADEGGTSDHTNVEGVRPAIPRWVREGESAEASGIASKETVLRVHLARAFGDRRLDEITTEDVQTK
jgi:hypothetical protein